MYGFLVDRVNRTFDPDLITDFEIGVDKLDILTASGLDAGLPQNFYRASNQVMVSTSFTSVNNLAQAVFANADGAGTALAANSAALVQAYDDSTGTTKTYIAINNDTAGYSSSGDMMIDITGFSGSLPAVGNANSSIDLFFL